MLNRKSFESFRMWAYQQKSMNNAPLPRFFRKMLARTSIHRAWLQGTTGSFLISVIERTERDKIKMAKFSNEQIEVKAAEKLDNSCVDVRLGKIELAAWSHSSVYTTQMMPSESSEEGESIFVGFRLNQDSFIAKIFPKHNQATIYHISDEGMEKYCEMSMRNFFRFLNTLPNMAAFGKTINSTPIGNYLLANPSELE